MANGTFRIAFRGLARGLVVATGTAVVTSASCATADGSRWSHCHVAHCGRMPDALLDACDDGLDAGATGRCVASIEGGCAWETAPCAGAETTKPPGEGASSRGNGEEEEDG